MAFTPQFLDELKMRTSLSGIIGKRHKLVRKGRDLWACCPFHNEKTPSFHIEEQKGFYHCFGCGAHGTAIDFVMETEGLSFPETVRQLAESAGMDVPEDSPEERERAKRAENLFEVMELATEHYEKLLRLPEGKEALDYLHGRGLTDSTIKKFRLGFAADRRDGLKGALTKEGVKEGQMIEAGLIIQPEDQTRKPYDRFRGRVIFPITDARNRVIAFGGRIMAGDGPKYLNSPETPLFHKGRTVYALASARGPARERKQILVTEGYMDVIALAQGGFDNAVAPLGTALTEEQIALLWRIDREPILCFDGDTAGQRAAARAAERALPQLQPGQGLKFVILPEGEDPDSLISKQGAGAVQALLNEAFPLSEQLWRMEGGNRVEATPEQKGWLEKRLKEHAFKIPDQDLRNHYLQDIRDRLWKLGRQEKGNRQNFQRSGWTPKGKGPPSRQLEPKSGVSTKVDARTVREKILTYIILSFPEYFDRLEDEYWGLDLIDARLSHLRDDLSEIAAGLAITPAKEQVLEALRERGREQELNYVLNDPICKNHKHLREAVSFESVEELWKEQIEQLHDTQMKNELNPQNYLTEGGEALDWERMQAVINENLKRQED
jgi:DNA primase